MPDATDGLESPDTWDWETAERLPAVPNAGVVVSVRYSAAEFDAIAERAESEGLSATEYIRRVALDEARRRSPAP